MIVAPAAEKKSTKRRNLGTFPPIFTILDFLNYDFRDFRTGSPPRDWSAQIYFNLAVQNNP